MQFNPEETQKLKAMLTFLVKKKHGESGGHCGFHITELQPILDELANEGIVIARPTIHNTQYFLNDRKEV